MIRRALALLAGAGWILVAGCASAGLAVAMVVQSIWLFLIFVLLGSMLL